MLKTITQSAVFLFGYDGPLTVDRQGNKSYVGDAEILQIPKENGASVPLGLFCSEQLNEVSAVVFSSTATFSKAHVLSSRTNAPRIISASRFRQSESTPLQICCLQKDYTETLCDGLHIFVNPYAREALDVRIFQGREIAIHHHNASGEYDVQVPDGFLFQRMSIAYTQGEVSESIKKSVDCYKEYSRPSWTEMELVPVEGNVLTFVDNHLSHVQG